MSIRIISTLLAASFITQAPAYAQSFAEQSGQPDRRATIGVTIPFGSQRTDDTKPRLDLRVRNESANWNTRSHDKDLRQWKPDTRIGVTLDKKPTVMLNGQKIAQPDKKARLGTWGYVAIGTVVVLAVSGALLWDAMVDASD